MEPRKTNGRGALGERLRAARAVLGWTREELAVQSGMSWSAIAQIESGRRPNPRSQTIAALAEALGVSAEYLLGRSTPAGMLRHHALFYDSPEEFVESAGGLVAEAVGRGEAALVVASSDKASWLKQDLSDDAGHVRFEDSQAWHSTLPKAMAAYRDFALSSLDSGASWVTMLGGHALDGATLAEIREWSRFESLLNLVLANYPVTLVCPYSRSRDAEILQIARETHRTTLTGEGIEKSADFCDPAQYALTAPGTDCGA